jgi:thioredoxin-disulfide reductase
MRDLIIIGGGAAGITAGIYAARKYLSALLIARDFTGQIGTSPLIENYPGFKKISGLDLIKKFKEHLELFENLEIKAFESVREIKKIKQGWQIITDENKYESKAVIIATGSLPKKLNIKNEDKFLGQGISYCVTCDETSFKDKIVAVIGGGNAGVEAALELARFCSRVYVLEYLNELSADKILQAEIKKNKKIVIITAVAVKAFQGGKKLEKIIYQNRKSKKNKEIIINGCFIEIGANPNTEFVKDFLLLNKKGEIKVNSHTLETSVQGIFAAGDVTDLSDKQIIIAAGQGATALLSANKYLNKK